jgi:hypothetical protein
VKHVALFLCLFICSFIQKASGQAAFEADSLRYWKLIVDNDISSQTDRQYTAGFIYEQVGPRIGRWPLLKVLPWHSRADHSGLRVELALYTPKDIFTDAPPTVDRPYASTFLFYLFSRSFFEESSTWVDSRIGLGMIGPSSQSWRLQNLIHALTPYSENVVGWKYQVADAFLLQYELGLQQRLFSSRFTALQFGSGIRLGSAYTDLSLNAEWRLGYLPSFRNEFQTEKGKHIGYFFIRPQLRYALFNVTLQSSLIGSSSELLKRDLITELGTVELGFNYCWSLTEIRYSQSFISPEYVNGPYHSWGSLSLTFYLDSK